MTARNDLARSYGLRQAEGGLRAQVDPQCIAGETDVATSLQATMLVTRCGSQTRTRAQIATKFGMRAAEIAEAAKLARDNMMPYAATGLRFARQK